MSGRSLPWGSIDDIRHAVPPGSCNRECSLIVVMTGDPVNCYKLNIWDFDTRFLASVFNCPIPVSTQGLPEDTPASLPGSARGRVALR